LRLALLDALRGHAGSARQHLSRCGAWAASDDVQSRSGYAATESGVALAEEDFRLALEAALRAIGESLRGGIGLAHEAIRLAFPCAVDAAMAIPDLDEADRLVELLTSRPPGEIPPFLRAQIRRARSLSTAARGSDEGVEEGLLTAEEVFRDLGYPYWTARVQLDLAEWLTAQARVGEAVEHAGEAAATFERLGTQPMLVRARALCESDAVVAFGGVESRGTG